MCSFESRQRPTCRRQHHRKHICWYIVPARSLDVFRSHQAQNPKIQCQVRWCNLYNALVCRHSCIWAYTILSNLWKCKSPSVCQDALLANSIFSTNSTAIHASSRTLKMGTADDATFLRFLLLTIAFSLKQSDRTAGSLRYYCSYPTSLGYGSP